LMQASCKRIGKRKHGPKCLFVLTQRDKLESCQ
jgi:hypothetical protein